MSLLEAGRIIAGRYRLERQLARGGMGSVWVARHLQLGTEVAIKFMAPGYTESTEARARFEREAKASAQLKSPNVVNVYDYGLEDDAPYIVMELLEGEDLDARLRRERRLSPAATLSIVTQVSKALRRAHEAGLVHRDLKPANIFLARQGDDEVVKVLDFGVAKATGPALVGSTTKTGSLLGSPLYMSPEQVRQSKAVDLRSDLWSLGVIVFQCLTGRLPFVGEEIGDVLVAVCADEIPRASEVAKDLEPAVDAFLARALTREPSQRFQSAHAFAAAFAAAVDPTGAEAKAFHPSLPEEPARPPSALSSVAVAGTLSPSGGSVVSPPSRGGRLGVTLSLLGGALLALGVFSALRVFSPKAAPREAEGPAAQPAEARAPAQAPPSAPLPSASAAIQAPGSASVAAPSRPRAAPKSAPRPARPKPTHDPLDHL